MKQAFSSTNYINEMGSVNVEKWMEWERGNAINLEEEEANYSRVKLWLISRLSN